MPLVTTNGVGIVTNLTINHPYSSIDGNYWTDTNTVVLSGKWYTGQNVNTIAANLVNEEAFGSLFDTDGLGRVTSISAINSFTASQNSFNASATASLIELLNFSSSLDVTYATDAQLAYSASVLQSNIDTKLNTSSFNDYTASTAATQSVFSSSVATSFSQSYAYINSVSSSVSQSILSLSSSISASDNVINGRINTLSSFTGSYATTGSNAFVGNQIISSSITITGSAYGNVFSASITSNTASIDLSVANFFTLALPNGVNTIINITNPKPGTTAILEITNNGIATASFNANVKQQIFNNYEPTSGSAVDLLSIISLSTSSIYVANSLNFV